VIAYNRDPGDNPLSLLPAIDLYSHCAFQQLADHIGRDNTYILSAGWGLLRADFLTPNYDITFSSQAAPYKRRRKHDHFDDLRQLSPSVEAPIVFFGGKDYLPLFEELTKGAAERIAFYNSINQPHVDGIQFKRFATSTKTNWHYQCVNAFISMNQRSLTRP